MGKNRQKVVSQPSLAPSPQPALTSATASASVEPPRPDVQVNSGWLASSMLALAAFVVYILTLYPSTGGGDSGELIATVCAMGVAHPPGYPLWTLLAKLFTMLVPIGTMAYRMNILSAVFGSICAMFISCTVSILTDAPFAGVLAGGLFAATRLAWENATQAEVFALNNAIVAVALYLTTRFIYTEKKSVVFAGAFVLGLGGSNQHTLVFYAAPITISLLWWYRKALLNVTDITKLTVCLIAGLLPYIYLPISASFGPNFTWGDQRTVDGFLTHFLRKAFGTFQLGGGTHAPSPTPEQFYDRLWLYWRNVLTETAYFGPVLAALAVLCLFVYWRSTSREYKRTVGLFVFCFAFYTLVFQYLANLPLDELNKAVQARFYMQANIVVCICIGIGAYYLIDRWAKVPKLLSAIVMTAVLVGVVASRYHECDRSDMWLMHEHAQTALESMPPNAMLLLKGDIHMHTMVFLQQCEHFRTDVLEVSIPMQTHPWYIEMNARMSPRLKNIVFPGKVYTMPTSRGTYDIKQLIDANIRKRPVYVLREMHPHDESWKAAYELWPHGAGWHVVPKDDLPDIFERWEDTANLSSRADLRLMNKEYPSGSWEALLQDVYWDSRRSRATHMLQWGINHQNHVKALKKAVKALKDTLDLMRRPWSMLYRDLGIAYVSLNKPKQARDAWAKYLDSSDAATDGQLHLLQDYVANYDRDNPVQ
eukprot:TRINITY_DN10249_c0_g1_i2.p1 TRINITY_DN10249_c0_g1~~TRINITY_DN10249_c0_g1_i2.p1  ORF type:complete len:706 (-),score=142.26 TRINITY_DN10249_c0_g1_i2:13-2130(-)